MAADAPSAIVRAMNRHRDKAKVQENGCRALSYIAAHTDAHKEAVVAADAPRAIVRAMNQHQNKSKVQENGCGALANIIASSVLESLFAQGSNTLRRRQALSNAGAKSALESAKRRHGSNNGIVTSANSVLSEI